MHQKQPPAKLAVCRPAGGEVPFHLRKALENGVSRDELIEVITHLAFYSGWPTANTALSVARRVFEEAGA